MQEPDPPLRFGIVEPGVYRSNALAPPNFAFIESLSLRTVVYLSPDLPSAAVQALYTRAGVDVHSVGLAVEYAHLAEDLFSNSLSTLAGPIMLGSHASVVVGYTCMKLWQSIDAHCGMSLPFPLTPWNVLPGMDCARAHDYHHSHNNGNYGGFFMFWDRVCGTDVKYRSRQSPVKKDN